MSKAGWVGRKGILCKGSQYKQSNCAGQSTPPNCNAKHFQAVPSTPRQPNTALWFRDAAPACAAAKLEAMGQNGRWTSCTSIKDNRLNVLSGPIHSEEIWEYTQSLWANCPLPVSGKKYLGQPHPPPTTHHTSALEKLERKFLLGSGCSIWILLVPM